MKTISPLGLVLVGCKAKERLDADQICGFSSSCALAGEIAPIPIESF